MVKFSSKQLKAIELLATGSMKQNDIAAQIGVAYQTLSKWKNNKTFIEAVIKRSRELLKEALPEIYKTSTDRAKDGDHHHIKILLEHIAKLEELHSRNKASSITFTWNGSDSNNEEE